MEAGNNLTDPLAFYLPFEAIVLVLEQVVPLFGYRNIPRKIDAYAKNYPVNSREFLTYIF